jgi:hypothetical protein
VRRILHDPIVNGLALDCTVQTGDLSRKVGQIPSAGPPRQDYNIYVTQLLLNRNNVLLIIMIRPYAPAPPIRSASRSPHSAVRVIVNMP